MSILFFENMSREFRFHHNLTSITVTLHEDQCSFEIYLASFSLEWEIFQTKVVEKIKTHVLLSINFFCRKSRLWDMWKNCCIGGQATDDDLTRQMRFACWITKASDTHTQNIQYLLIVLWHLRTNLFEIYTANCNTVLLTFPFVYSVLKEHKFYWLDSLKSW